jgi:hypothetical protein
LAADQRSDGWIVLPVATAVKVLDKHRVEARARLLDVAAVLVLAVVGFSLVVLMYKLGYSAANATAFGGQAVLDRDRLFVIAMAEGAVGMASLCWVGYRLLAASGRRAGG